MNDNELNKIITEQLMGECWHQPEKVPVTLIDEDGNRVPRFIWQCECGQKWGAFANEFNLVNFCESYEAIAVARAKIAEKGLAYKFMREIAQPLLVLLSYEALVAEIFEI